MGRPIANTRNRQYPARLDRTFTEEEDGLVDAPEVISGKFLRDDGTWQPAGEGGGGDAEVPTGTGFFHIVDGVQDEEAKLVENEDVAADAGIEESKLALNFPTHSNANDPTSGQKAALAGTNGTPSNANRYVTDSDPRLVASAGVSISQVAARVAVGI